MTITLKSATGATNAIQLSPGPQSQTIWNVNTANTFSGATPEVSAEVTTASSGSVVAAVIPKTTPPPTTTPTKTPKQKTTPTPAATPGTPTPTPPPGGAGIVVERELYFTYKHTLQNPTTKAETISVTLVNGSGRSSTSSFNVAANSRFTVDVTDLVQQVFSPGTSSTANSVSMTVQTLDGSPFVAERPMYWNTTGISPFVTIGGSDVLGYVGG